MFKLRNQLISAKYNQTLPVYMPILNQTILNNTNFIFLQAMHSFFSLMYNILMHEVTTRHFEYDFEF